MVSLFLSRVLGLIREAIVAAKFGQSEFTEAYNAAFQVPDLLFYLIAGGALSSAFIPVFSEYLHTNREEDAWHIFSAVASIMAVVITAFILVCSIFAPALVHLAAPGITGPEAEQIYAMAASMARILLPAQFAFFIGGILFGTLYSRQIFTVPGLGPNIYNIGIIIGAVVISQFTAIPTAGMSWGATAGAFLGNIVVPLWAMRKIGLNYKFTLSLKHPGVKKVFRLMAPVVFGLSLPGVFALFLNGFASYYTKPGESYITAFKNANVLMQAPLGVFGQSMAIGVFPALSQFFAQERMDLFRDQLIKTLRSVLYLSIPVALILGVCSADIIRLLFEYSNYTPQDTARTAPLLTAFAVGIPFWCLQPVLMRAFFSIQNTLRPILLGTTATAIFFAAAAAAVNLKLPPYALAAAGSLAAIFLAILLCFQIKAAVPQTDLYPLYKTLVKSLVAAIPATAVFWGIFRIAEQFGFASNKIANLAIGLFFGLCALWVYYFITKFFNMPEAKTLDRVANRINRKKTEPSPDNPS